MLTARESREDVVLGLEAGADDYVIKPFDAHELQMRVRTGRRIVDLHEKLRYYATHDSLTGLLNRRTVFERLNAEISRAKRENNPLTIALLDLDHFKEVNDKYGHVIGDGVLCEIALRIRSTLRSYDFIGLYESYDIVGRYGGEEFLIVAPGVGPSDAENVFERVRSCISDQEMNISGTSVSVTASVGVITLDRDASLDQLTQLINAADKELYLAKQEGRNCVKCKQLG
jgi:diguanylate cyclase (GGDEF)-like protein